MEVGLVRLRNRSSPSKNVLVLLGMAFLLALTATACDPGANVTYVNNTDGTIHVEVNNGGGILVKSHATSRLGVIGRDQDPYVVVVTNEQGHVLYHESTTFGEIKKRNQPIVIGEPTPSATPP